MKRTSKYVIEIFFVVLTVCVIAIYINAVNRSNKVTSSADSLVSDTFVTGANTIPKKLLYNDNSDILVDVNEKKASIQEILDAKPNESGNIMIHMLHRFEADYSKSYDKGITITYDNFWKYLETLYEQNYRPISMQDFIDNEISTPLGYKPMILTFDDGWSSQFHLIEENGELVVAPNTAVGILEKFNAEHPDFELKGIFYVNFGVDAFAGAGTMEERIEYLVSRGFELGNHTLDHLNLTKIKSSEKIIYQVGANEKELKKYAPNETFLSLALPYGNDNKELKEHIKEGEYDGVKYKNYNILLASAEPSFSPNHVNFDPWNIKRVLAPGIADVYMDATWWLENATKESLYVSDGDPNTITIPKEKLEVLNQESLTDKELITY